MGIGSGPEDVHFIQQHKLHIHIDRLIGAILHVKPTSPKTLFANLHEEIRKGDPKRYQEWLKATDSNLENDEAVAPDLSLHRVVSNSDGRDLVESAPCKTASGPSQFYKFFGCTEDQLTEADHHVGKLVDQAGHFSPSYPAGNVKGKFSLQNQVHWKFRLAALFLDLVGRDPRVTYEVKSSKGHFDYDNQTTEESANLPGLPNVKLMDRLQRLEDDAEVVISADSLENLIATKYGQKEKDRMLKGWYYKNDVDGNPADGPLPIDSCVDIFGPGQFKLTGKDVKDLEASTKFYTGRSLPSKFFLQVINIASRDETIAFYNERKAQPLAWLTSIDCDLGRFIKSLWDDKAKQEEFGFDSSQHFIVTMQQSLTELSTQVVVAQKGFFFVGNDNQIMDKPPNPILFLSAPGIDFNSGAAARAELEKYFLQKRFRPGCKDRFKKRLKRTYHCLFMACKDYGVTHPTAIAMGLGMFLPKIEADEVKRLYHEAQFELLAEHDYGFHVYCLNPGPGTGAANAILKTKNYPFKCKLMLHKKDGKAMATQLATAGFKTSFLNPSDFIAVLQGCIGYWWEGGLGERYAGEEDFAATSTAILARSNICRVWSAVDEGIEKEVLKENCVWVPDPSGTNFEEAEIMDMDVVGEAAITHFFPPYPKPQASLPNPVVSEMPFRFRWHPQDEHELKVEHELSFYRIIWADTKQNHILHLQPLINDLRKHGIVVDQVSNTEDAMAALNKPTPCNFLITNLFEYHKKGEEETTLIDSGEKLIAEACASTRAFTRIICACTRNLSSSERSLLYSMGASTVQFDLHVKVLEDFMSELCLMQRYSDRLCNTLDGKGIVTLQMVETLIDFGVDVDFAPKSWAPLHYVAHRMMDEDTHMLPVMKALLNAGAQLECRSIYVNHGVPKGATPLTVALMCGSAKGVQELLRAGANPDATYLEVGSVFGSINTPRKWMKVMMEEHFNTKRKAMLKQVSKDMAKIPETEPSACEIPARHEMLSVLWIGTESTLSENTRNVRSLIESSPGMIVEDVCCPIDPDLCQDKEQFLAKVKAWIYDFLLPLCASVGTSENSYFDENKEPLVWLQTIVIELRSASHLLVWKMIADALGALCSGNSEGEDKPWLKIVTYAENFPIKPFWQLDETYQSERFTKIGDTRTTHPQGHKQARNAQNVILNETPCRREIVVGVSYGPDADSHQAKSDLSKFQEKVQNAVVYWAWDFESDDRRFPDYPYNARKSAEVERQYRGGHPSVKVSPVHAIYYKDMVQRQIKDPMKLRLVFRYPIPCLDCDKIVRSHENLVQEIRQGNCIMFLGAGFCMPANGPSWKQLLLAVAEVAESRHKSDSFSPFQKMIRRSEIEKLLSPPADHTHFELAAQMLEDALKDKLQLYLSEIMRDRVQTGWTMMQDREKYPVMASRLDCMQCMNFPCVMTTNYTHELCVCDKVADPSKTCNVCMGVTPLSVDSEGNRLEPPYVDISRIQSNPWDSRERPVISMHGNIVQPKTIVLSREGYRSLLHERPNYAAFLKSIMMTRTILYMGFSFQDEYLNEIRSDVMAMKKHSQKTKTLAYAIINDKSKALQSYYDEHEGVKMLTWTSSTYGFGIYDRMLTSILSMTDLAAALSGGKVVLYNPQINVGVSSTSTCQQHALSLKLELQKYEKQSQVWKYMPPDYYQRFNVSEAGSLSEVERMLRPQTSDFLQSWVVIFAEEDWDVVPLHHRELIQFLWHPHARLDTDVYPPIVIVWGSDKTHTKRKENSTYYDPIPLKQQYESNLHVKFCTSQEEILKCFARSVSLDPTTIIEMDGDTLEKTITWPQGEFATPNGNGTAHVNGKK